MSKLLFTREFFILASVLKWLFQMARPVVITSDDFAGDDELSSDQLDQLLVDNLTDVAANLVSGWDPNGLIIIPALYLNNTNSGIDNATVVLQGRTEESCFR